MNAPSTTAPERRADPERDLEHHATTARLAGWSGIAFTVAFVAGFVLVAQVPAYDAPDDAWVAWIEEDHVATVIGTLLLSAAGLLLMTFTTSLAAHLHRASGDTRTHLLETLRGAGTIAGAALLIAALLGGGMAAGVTFAPEFEAPDADIIRALDQLSLGVLLVGTGWSTAVALFCASRAGRGPAALPGWLTATGQVAAAALLLSFTFVPIVLVPLWALVTGVVLLRRSSHVVRDREVGELR